MELLITKIFNEKIHCSHYIICITTCSLSFFASGINHFAQLPVLTNDIEDVSDYSNETFKNKITILGFFGTNVQDKHGDALNLNQKIYKRFYQFKDFQFLMIQPKGTDSLVMDLKFDLKSGTDTDLVIGNF